jgi:predicted RNase H-like HicB family nuclease
MLSDSGRKGKVDKMCRFLSVVDKAYGVYFTYSPALPGGVATGESRDQLARNTREPLETHVGRLPEDILPVLEPHSFAEHITVPLDPLQSQ